jgi:ParB/RepB/Spo0J family partition protein
MDAEQQQPRLVPEVRPKVEDVTVPLADLPPDERLECDEPGDDLVRSIGEFGLFHPIGLVEVPYHNDEGDVEFGYDLVFGRRRIKAARKAGLEMIPARVFIGMTLFEAQTAAVQENAVRSRNLLVDYQAIRRMVAAGYSEKQIAAAVGLTLGAVRQRMRLASLVPDLHDRFVQGSITSGQAMTLARQTEIVQRRVVAALEAGEELTGSLIDEMRQARTSQVAAALFDQLEDVPRPGRAAIVFERLDPVAGLGVDVVVVVNGVRHRGKVGAAAFVALLMQTGAVRPDEEEAEDATDHDD